MRPTCLNCCRKHLAKADILLTEARLGYPQHVARAIGNLSEAEDEIVGAFPRFAELIRTHRKKLEESLALDPDGRGYDVPIDELFDIRDRCAATNTDYSPAETSPPTIGIPPPVFTPDVFLSRDPNPLVVDITTSAIRNVTAPDAVKEELDVTTSTVTTVPPPHEQPVTTVPHPPVATKAPGQCVSCEENAKFQRAIVRWRNEEETGLVDKHVVILTTLSDFNPAYSLVTVVLDQVRAAALIPKARVSLLILANANTLLLPPLPDNAAVFGIVPPLHAGEDTIDERHVNAIATWMKKILNGLRGATIITHDLVFQSWFSTWAKMFHQLGTVEGVAFYHMMHSSVSSRPSKPEAIWRSTVPAGHTMVALNYSDIPYLARYYDAPPERFVTLRNPRDVRSVYNMPPLATELVTKHRLHQQAVFQIFPLSAPRMATKGLTKTIDIFAALAKHDQGQSVCLLVADAHANGIEGKLQRSIMRKYAQGVGLPDECLVFTSESLGPINPEVLSQGLDGPSVQALFHLSNVFIFPTTSEAGSLALMEAALAGVLLVLNASLPCMADYIPSQGALWVPFGSAKELAGTWSPAEVATKIHEALENSPVLLAKSLIAREHSLEAYAENMQELLHLVPAGKAPAITVESIPLRQATLLK